ncbi:IPT/TIG domain-containing protein [Streptomyces sp. NPDC001056]
MPARLTIRPHRRTPTAPVTTSISPTRGTAGTDVVITGTGFGALAGAPTVSFGNTSVSGAVTIANAQITVTTAQAASGLAHTID